VIPKERGKGYCTEAVRMMVDYLFLSKDLSCVQAMADVRNMASERVLEKAGFHKEGTIRKRFFIRGEWTDNAVYSILKEEWKEPRILTRTWRLKRLFLSLTYGILDELISMEHTVRVVIYSEDGIIMERE
jgi:hypothetical protein